MRVLTQLLSAVLLHIQTRRMLLSNAFCPFYASTLHGFEPVARWMRTSDYDKLEVVVFYQIESSGWL